MLKRKRAARPSKAKEQISRPAHQVSLHAAVQRALHAPDALTSADVLALQRTVGNAALQHLVADRARPSAPQPPAPQPPAPLPVRLGTGRIVQPKLAVGPADDGHEREADAIAKRVVVQAPSPTAQRAARVDASQSHLGPEGGRVDQALDRRIRSDIGGSPMPAGVRSALEPKLGADLSGVKVHTGNNAADLNRQLSAKAFTHKNHIYYGAGQSPHDLQLTAHETVHTLQQGATSISRRQAATHGAQLGAKQANNSIQRLTLTIGDAEKERQVPDMPKWGVGGGRGWGWGRTVSGGDHGSSFLGDEQGLVKEENEENDVTEESYQIRDKWGDRALEKKYAKWNPVRSMARKFGGGKFGKRRSFKPNSWLGRKLGMEDQRYLRNLGKNEDLKLIAHGGGDKVAGYTPAKLVSLLISLGLTPNHKGAIWLRGCIAAWRKDGTEGSSFIEIMQRDLKGKGFKNEVYGLAGLAMSNKKQVFNPATNQHDYKRIAQEESFDPAKYGRYTEMEKLIEDLKAQIKELQKSRPEGHAEKIVALRERIDFAEDERDKNKSTKTDYRTWIKAPGYVAEETEPETT